MKNDRIIDVWEAVVEAMRRVVREEMITEQELLVAGQYFNRLGQSGMFPSLLTVALVMTSSDLARGSSKATRSNPQGPFYKPHAPLRESGVLLDREPSGHAVILNISGCVRDSETGQPVTRAELDFWQTNEDGVYDNDGFHLRGVVRTDAQGLYCVRTVVAKDYEEHDNDPIGELFRALGRHNRRAGHIHLKVRCDRYAPLTTQLFMGDSAYLGSDYIEGAVSPDLTLLFEASNAGGHGEVNAKFDIALRPAVTVSMAGAAAGSGGTSP